MHPVGYPRINLVLTGTEVFLSESISLPLSALDLPSHIQSFPNTATWMVEVLRYFEDQARIYCHILSYQTGNKGFLPQQENLGFLSQLKRISFASINTSQLMKTFAGEKVAEAIVQHHRLHKKDHIPSDESSEMLLPYSPYDTDQILSEQIPHPAPPTDLREVNYSYKVFIKDLKFRFGGVSFTQYLRETGKNEEIIIFNQELREEFDAVKNYFSNILKTKSITANVVFIFKNGVLDEVKAWSSEISKINSQTIETVKFELVDKIKKPRFWIDTDRNLFTADDLLDEFLGGKGQKNQLFSDENDLLEHFLSIENVKHYRHLRYLSSKHAHDLMRLRFVIKPFSFVFLVAGERRYYIIWETLNTEEATYLWHTEKERSKLKLQLSRVEAIINTVKVMGKTAYINSKSDINFKRVLHDYHDPLEGFIKWKGEIDQLLI